MAISRNDIEPKDQVDHPSHYNNGKIETIEYYRSQYGDQAVLYFCLLNADKYLSRALLKGKTREDIEKAIWYLNYIINNNLENSLLDF